MPQPPSVSRRQFVLAATAASGGCRSRKADTSETDPSDLLEMSAVDAIAAMKGGALAAERYALAVLKQCERGKALNAFITLDGERILSAGRAADQRRKSGAKL